MYGYIYKTTNLITKKIYIGQHKAKQFEPNRYIGGGKLLAKAIAKYGKNNFKNELIEWAESREILSEREIFWINFYDATNPNIGYNIHEGGFGGCDTMSEETRQKISNSSKERVMINNGIISKNVKKDNLDTFLKNGWQLGVLSFSRTEEDKYHHSIAQTGRVAMSNGELKTWAKQEDVEQLLAAGYILGWPRKAKDKKTIGTVKPFRWMYKDDAYKKVSITYWDSMLADGWIFKGYSKIITHKKGVIPSESTRQKLSISHKGHHPTKEAIEKQAEKLRGRIWVHNGTIRKLVTREVAAELIASGWVIGFKVETGEELVFD